MFVYVGIHQNIIIIPQTETAIETRQPVFETHRVPTSEHQQSKYALRMPKPPCEVGTLSTWCAPGQKVYFRVSCPLSACCRPSGFPRVEYDFCGC